MSSDSVNGQQFAVDGAIMLRRWAMGHLPRLLALAAAAMIAPAFTQGQPAAPVMQRVAHTDSFTLERKSISLAGALRVISAAKLEAAQQGWLVSIAVVDAAGDLVAFERLDGAVPISTTVAQGKARTAAWIRSPSKTFEDFVNSGKLSFATVPGLVPLEGGMPLMSEGQIVGAIGVSGARGDQDAQVAQAGAAALGAATGAAK